MTADQAGPNATAPRFDPFDSTHDGLTLAEFTARLETEVRRLMTDPAPARPQTFADYEVDDTTRIRPGLSRWARRQQRRPVVFPTLDPDGFDADGTEWGARTYGKDAQ